MSNESLFYSLFDKSQGINRDLAPGLTTRIFPGDQAMLSIVEVEPNAAGNIHSHPQEQWGFLLEGCGTRIQGGKDYEVKKGSFWRTPGGVEHGFKAGPKGAKIIDVFSPPRDEYKKPGSGFSETEMREVPNRGQKRADRP